MDKRPLAYDLVLVGNYTKDTIVSSSGTRIVDGGGFNYGAHAAVLTGLRVAAVTRLAKEDSRVLEALKHHGVDVFATFTPDSTRLKLEYPGSDPDERVLSVTSSAGSYAPTDFDNLQAGTFLITASLRGEVGLDVIHALRHKEALLAADVQGFVRIVTPDGILVYQDWPEKREILSCIDVLKTDAVEAEMLTGEKDIHTASRILADLGPREIVLTHRGGLLVHAEGTYHEAPFHPKRLVGRSGRGDTCFASYLSKRLTAPVPEATIWAAAVTSLKMENEGPISGRSTDVKDLIRRMYGSKE